MYIVFNEQSKTWYLAWRDDGQVMIGTNGGLDDVCKILDSMRG